MKESVKKNAPLSRRPGTDPRASRQAPASEILQRYAGRTPAAASGPVIQKVDEEYFGEGQAKLTYDSVPELRADQVTATEKSGIPALGATNTLIPGTRTFHIASASGSLIIREPERHYVVASSRLGEMKREEPIDIDRIITSDISSCSFIVLTNEDRDFALVAHLDSKSDVNALLAEMERREKVPTRLFASLFTRDDGETSFREEKLRIRQYIETYGIPNISILDRESVGQEKSHPEIGYDLQAGEVFGTLGMDREFFTRNFESWMNLWQDGMRLEDILRLNQIPVEGLRRYLIRRDARYEDLEQAKAYCLSGKAPREEVFMALYMSVREKHFRIPLFPAGEDPN